MFMSDIINQIDLNTDKKLNNEIFDITVNGTSKYEDNSHIDNLVMPIIIDTGDETSPIEFIADESTLKKLVFTDPRIKDMQYFRDISGKNTGMFEILSIEEDDGEDEDSVKKYYVTIDKDYTQTTPINNKIVKSKYIPEDDNYGFDNSLDNLSTDIPKETNTIQLFTLISNQLIIPSGSNSKYMPLPTATRVKYTSSPNIIEVEVLTSTMPKETTQDIVLEDTAANIKTSFGIMKRSDNYIVPTDSFITIEEYKDFIKYNNSEVGYKYYKEVSKDSIVSIDKIINIADDITAIPIFMKNMDNIFKLKITNTGSASLINNNLVKPNRMDNFLHNSSNEIFYLNFDDIMTNNNELHFIKTENDNISFTIDIISPIIENINYNLTFYV